MKDNIVVDSKEIGKSLKKIRLTHNLSQKEFAEILNVSSLLVSKWENGERTPRIETFKKINKIYGITFEEITTGLFKPELTNKKALYHFLRFNIVKISLIIIICMILFLCALLENQIKVYNLAIESKNIIVNKGTLVISNNYTFDFNEIDNKYKTKKVLLTIFIKEKHDIEVYSCLLNGNTCKEVYHNDKISTSHLIKKIDNLYVEIKSGKQVENNKLQLTMITNTQEIRNLVKIPNDLLKEKDKEDHIDNCIYVDKKKLIDNIEKSSKMFKIRNELYIVRKDFDIYTINNNNNTIIIPTNNDDIYCIDNKIVELFLIVDDNQICLNDKHYYSLLYNIINYYK